MEQEIGFCASDDGVRLTNARAGSGPPLVFLPRWISHLELNWQSRRDLLAPLGNVYTLIRYDKRGTGLSDRQIDDFSIDAQLRDFDTLVRHLGLRRFSLYASSAGGSVAITYTALHPEQVDKLVLYGTFARLEGVAGRRQTNDALLALIRAEWGLASTALTDLFTPGASAPEREAFALTQKLSADAEVAARLWESFVAADVRALLPRIHSQTLVVHAKGDRAVPVECGWELAAGIPGASFLTLDTDRHVLSNEHESQLWAAVLDFLKGDTQEGSRSAPTAQSLQDGNPAGLSGRELQVLRLIAAGRTNHEISSELFISLSTAAHHVSNILAKTGVENRTQAAAYALGHGI
jgi:pimeloyl-ACP methyl ester carboxylesterase/DNA-binding CsgD family transcriptional regulator